MAVVCCLPTQYKFALHTQGSLHPWIHLLAFGMLTFAFVSGVRLPLLRAIFVLLMLAFGWGTEFIEHLMDHWPVESGDVFLDSVGVLVGAGVAMIRSLYSEHSLPK